MDWNIIASDVRSLSTSVENLTRDVGGALKSLADLLESHAQQQSDHLREMNLILEKIVTALNSRRTCEEPDRNDRILGTDQKPYLLRPVSDVLIPQNPPPPVE